MPEPWPRPQDGATTPRFAGATGFMRLPQRPSAEGLDIALLGIPFDGGTTNRPGARHGPRAVREASTLIRRVHPVSLVAPFDLCRVADAGDAPVNPVDLRDSLARIEDHVAALRAAGAWVLSVGGDHLTTLPVLRGMARIAATPLGLIHFDAHSDTSDSFFGSTLTHGTPFHRAVEEGLLDPHRIIQVGIRGTLYDADDMAWARSAGIRILTMEECVALGPEGVAAEVLRVVGDAPAYLSFDVDALDPSFAPGTGTPEWGGFTPREVQAMLRGLRGLPIIGADVVEVSPPFDLGGTTALAAASVMFEILCLMVEARVAAG